MQNMFEMFTLDELVEAPAVVEGSALEVFDAISAEAEVRAAEEEVNNQANIVNYTMHAMSTISSVADMLVKSNISSDTIQAQMSSLAMAFPGTPSMPLVKTAGLESVDAEVGLEGFWETFKGWMSKAGDAIISMMRAIAGFFGKLFKSDEKRVAAAKAYFAKVKKDAKDEKVDHSKMLDKDGKIKQSTLDLVMQSYNDTSFVKEIAKLDTKEVFGMAEDTAKYLEGLNADNVKALADQDEATRAATFAGAVSVGDAVKGKVFDVIAKGMEAESNSDIKKIVDGRLKDAKDLEIKSVTVAGKTMYAAFGKVERKEGFFVELPKVVVGMHSDSKKAGEKVDGKEIATLLGEDLSGVADRALAHAGDMAAIVTATPALTKMIEGSIKSAEKFKKVSMKAMDLDIEDKGVKSAAEKTFKVVCTEVLGNVRIASEVVKSGLGMYRVPGMQKLTFLTDLVKTAGKAGGDDKKDDDKKDDKEESKEEKKEGEEEAK